MDGGASVKTYTVLVEWELPDDVDFTIAARPLMDAVRELAPCPPANVTASTGDDAARIIAAQRGELPLIERVQAVELNPGDVVVLTAQGRISLQDAEELRSRAEKWFPGHEVRVLDGLELSVLRPG
jgi:hypothetical protein